MSGGGGDSGDGGAAQRKAAEDARIAAATKKINDLFGTSASDAPYQQRETLYSTIGDDAKNYALTDLNKERGITERDLGFNLARNGLSGGSRDIDANKDILDTFQQGVLKASNLGQNTANNARSADDKTRVNLINSVRSGLDENSALQQSYEGMANNARAAQDEANTTSLAGFFGTLQNQLNNAQYQQGVQSVLNPQQSVKKVSSTASYGGTTRAA